MKHFPSEANFIDFSDDNEFWWNRLENRKKLKNHRRFKFLKFILCTNTKIIDLHWIALDRHYQLNNIIHSTIYSNKLGQLGNLI